MSVENDPSQQLAVWIERLMQGDERAPTEILAIALQQVEIIVRNILRRSYGNLKRQHETASIMSRVYLKLRGELDSIRQVPADDRRMVMDVRGFFKLVATRVHQVCLDLVRRLKRRELGGAVGDAATLGSGDRPAAHQPATMALSDPDAFADEDDPSEMALASECWRRLQERVATLPPDEQEVFTLCFYMRMDRAQAAQVLGVPPKTASRLWLSAVARLQDTLAFLNAPE
jgi:RNA polymerase sigma factor (sigma-70 family)